MIKEVEEIVEATKVIRAKEYLGDKTSIIESLAEKIKEASEEIRARIDNLLEIFIASEDEYTRSIGVYLEWLI